MPFRNLKGALVLGARPAVLISGCAYAGQIRGLMTANLPEVGAAQAAGSAGPAFAAIWAEAAVSITFNAQMCQASHPSSVGYISRAAANCFNRRGSVVPGTPRGAWGQPSASCPRRSPGRQVDRPRGDSGLRQGAHVTPKGPVSIRCSSREDRPRRVTRP